MVKDAGSVLKVKYFNVSRGKEKPHEAQSCQLVNDLHQVCCDAAHEGRLAHSPAAHLYSEKLLAANTCHGS